MSSGCAATTSALAGAQYSIAQLPRFARRLRNASVQLFASIPGASDTSVIAYFDTSALLELVISEPGSELAAELWTSAAR
jgi:hypothetical protein